MRYYRGQWLCGCWVWMVGWVLGRGLVKGLASVGFFQFSPILEGASVSWQPNTHPKSTGTKEEKVGARDGVQLGHLASPAQPLQAAHNELIRTSEAYSYTSVCMCVCVCTHTRVRVHVKEIFLQTHQDPHFQLLPTLVNLGLPQFPSFSFPFSWRLFQAQGLGKAGSVHRDQVGMLCAQQWASQILHPRPPWSLEPQKQVLVWENSSSSWKGRCLWGRDRRVGTVVTLPLLVWAGVPALGHPWESRPGVPFDPTEPPSAQGPLSAGS